MTPLLNEIPKRSPFAAELVGMVAQSLVNIDEIENDVKETNCLLSVCEIIISTPLEWYSLAEKACVITVVRRLYKQDFAKFCLDITIGNVSFYNKVKHYPDAFLPVGDRDQIIEALKSAHAKMR